jgi:hypothetical protein
MNIANFSDLLVAAATQSQPQRLLFVFTKAEAEPESEAPLGAPRRKTLVPVVCVDKQVGELDTFANLVAESKNMKVDWDVVLVTSLSGVGTMLPDDNAVENAFKTAIQAIQDGQLGRFLAFDVAGELLNFS